MTFLAPALLLLGLAVAVPLILHLLQRQQGPRLVFPALRYLKRAEREHARRIRLRQVLLLALRLLALLLLAAAAARPFLRGGGAGHAPTSVVLVLDNSLSTAAVVGDRRVLDELREAALRTLAAAGSDDRFWLIRAGAPWEPAISGNAATVAEAIRRTEPGPGAADLGAELERAGSILASEPEDRPREIQLLSDLQATSFHAVGAGDPRTAVVALVPAGEVPPNRGVVAVEVGGGLPPRAGERSTVTARVAAGGAAEDSVGARLVLDGLVRAAGTITAGAAVVLPFPARETGMVVGRVEIDADALTGDDRRHFVARVTPPPAVALAESLPFLAEALAVLADAGRVRTGTPGSADVVVAPGGRGAEAARDGRGVLVLPPASPLELSAANQRLSAAGIPWRFGPPAAGEARLQPREEELGQVLGDVRLRQTYPLEPQGASGDTVLLRLRTGEPWAIAGATAAGARYVLLGSPLTPEAGTIPTSAAMLPLLDRAIGAWSAGAAERAEHDPGEVVTLPEADSLVGPGATTGAVAAGTVHRLTEAGVYRALRAGETVAAWAVNPPAQESNLARAGAGAVRAALGGDARLATAGEWDDAIFARRLGREISWALILLALLLLVAEAAIAATGRGALRPRVAPVSAPAGPAGRAPAREGV